MHYEIVGDPYCWSHQTPEMPASRHRLAAV